jgi:dihydrofolate reductase
MGRIVVSQFVSLDGVIEDPVGMEGLGRGSWTSYDSGPEGAQFVLETLQGSAAFLMGRRTYEAYAAVWPERGGDYADKLNAMPKYVVSSTLDAPAWAGTTVLRGDAATAVARVKEETTGDILVHGSKQLTDALVAAGLVDAWRLLVFPVVVGAGRRCFGDPGEAVAMRLVDSRAAGDGVLLLTYEPRHAA